CNTKLSAKNSPRLRQSYLSPSAARREGWTLRRGEESTKVNPNRQREEATDEVHAVDAADGTRHARGPPAAAADRAEQRALPADARRAAQARGVCRRGRLRRLRHDRAPFPFGRLRDFGGAALALYR